MNRNFFEENSIGFLLLAGGKSSRMGQDKSRMAIGERTMAKIIADTVAASGLSFSEKFLSSNEEAALEGFAVLRDETAFAGMGPAAGILAALKNCRSQYLLVVPCDTPLIRKETICKLAETLARYAETFVDGTKALTSSTETLARDAESTSGTGRIPIVAESSRGLEPVIGIYPKTAAAAIEDALSSGIRKMGDILGKTGYKTVKIADEEIVNVNAPEDMARVQALFAAAEKRNR